LVTITACLMVETDSNRWRRAAPRSVPQPQATTLQTAENDLKQLMMFEQRDSVDEKPVLEDWGNVDFDLHGFLLLWARV
jgi:hypothetical protein